MLESKLVFIERAQTLKIFYDQEVKIVGKNTQWSRKDTKLCTYILSVTLAWT